MFHYAQEMFDGLKAFRGADGSVRFFRLDRHCRRLHDGRRGSVFRRSIRRFRAKRSWRWCGRTAIGSPDCRGRPSTSGPPSSRRRRFWACARRNATSSSSSPRRWAPISGTEAFSPARILVEDKYVRAAAGGLGGVRRARTTSPASRPPKRRKPAGTPRCSGPTPEHTYLEEVGTMNLVIRIGDELITPPLGGSILSGVTRDSVLTLLREWGFAVHERPLGMEEMIPAHKSRHVARAVRLRNGGGHHAGRHAGLERRGHRRQRGSAGRGVAPPVRRHHRHPVRPRARHPRVDDRSPKAGGHG